MSIAEDPDIRLIARVGAVPTILKVITQITGLRLALVARVTADDWKACAVHDALGFGLSVGDHLDVATTLCSEVRDAKQAIVIEHASADPLYCDHPTPKRYKFESYISTPIFLKSGDYFGNVCALDSRPLPLVERKAAEMMALFAQLIALQLDADERAQQTSAALLDARETGELREQFIAVLGHDLRTPLNSVLMGTELLLGNDLPEASKKIVERIRSSGRRMTRLVEDVLDFARGRLGGGIGVEHALVEDLDVVFKQVIDEQRVLHEGREIVVDIEPIGTQRGDRVRLGQLLANLVANALEHGPADERVAVGVGGSASELVISVSNRGAAIPKDVLPRLFQPYFRGPISRKGKTGLGLGLYIVSEIARSHGGSLSVTSSAEAGTTFCCVIPRSS